MNAQHVRPHTCKLCGLRLSRPRTAPASVPAPRPRLLRVLTGDAAALPDDIRVACLFQPRAPLGHLVVSVGLGQGSKGRGSHRIGDDPAVHAAVLRQLLSHLHQYLRDFEEAAADEEPDWWTRVAAASAQLGPLPALDR